MEDPASAASELRTVVPEAIARRIDWDSLERVPADLVSGSLQSLYPDLIFTARLIGELDVHLFFLLEHQSRNDRWMALRMLGYMYMFWDAYIKNHRRVVKLPILIPVTVHTGSDKLVWTAPTELVDMIDLPPTLDVDFRKELDTLLPRLRFLLDDIAATEPAELLQRPLTLPASLMLTAERIGPRNPHLVDDLGLIAGHLAQLADLPGGRKVVDEVINYLLVVADTNPDKLERRLEQISPTLKESVVTAAEILEKRGEKRGETHGRAHTLLMQLDRKFGPLPTWVTDTIDNAGPEQLDVWALEILTAPTLDDVFKP
jgi:hypothetical protein